LLESEQLYGRGLGWVDVHLLASAMLTQCSLWTLDKALVKAAKALRISA
jgi:predicted nucleic acid-binding protein